MTLDFLHISLADQRLYGFAGGQLCLRLPVSTAVKGASELNGSGCTPCGRHIVRAKIGAELPLGAVLCGRRWTGEIYSEALAQQFPERDWILTRILWLSGCEAMLILFVVTFICTARRILNRWAFLLRMAAFGYTASRCGNYLSLCHSIVRSLLNRLHLNLRNNLEWQINRKRR